MSFKSDAQRKWFFANRGHIRESTYVPGSDPIAVLYKHDNEKLKKAIDEGERILETRPDLSKEAKVVEDRIKLEGDSKTRFFDSHTNDYIEDRLKLHNRLIDSLDDPTARASGSEKPKVVFVGGLTASGKSTIISKLLKGNRKYIYLNSDDFKEKLPEYTGFNASELHEESTDVLEKAIVKYSKDHKNIIIDATLKNTENARENFKRFKDMGYDVELLGANITGENAIIRAANRAVRSNRVVPLKYIADAAEKTNKSVATLRRDPNVDRYSLYSNDVPKGENPILIESNKSLARDRKETSKNIVHSELEWRKKGTHATDLEGYDDSKPVPIKDEESNSNS